MVSKNNVGNAGEFHIAGILSQNDLTTTITLGRAEKYDLLVSSLEGKMCKVQVKTNATNKHKWPMNKKNETFEDDLFYAFVKLKDDHNFDYWLVPSELVSKYITESHQSWLNTPGRNGQKHNDCNRREFSVKGDKYSPDWFDVEEIKKYYNNIDILLDYVTK